MRLEQFYQGSDTPGLSKEELVGDLFHAALMLYFAEIDVHTALASRTLGIVSFRAPSYGNFGLAASPRYIFGVVRELRIPGVQIDVDRIATIDVDKGYDPRRVITARQLSGTVFSALEHRIPEGIFSTSGSGQQGLSAVRALQVAATQGQRIYSLTSSTAASLGDIEASPEVRQELANALSAGKHITVHAAPITTSGWTGHGYIISDPETGAGAYKISGGGNGGYIFLQAGLALFALTQLISALAIVGPLIGLTLVSATVGAPVLLAIGLLVFIGALFADDPF